MQGSKLLIICLFLSGISLEAQTFFSKPLEGRVYSKDGDVAATHVLNTTTKRATITDGNGFFSIMVNLNDTLLFSAVQFKKTELVVTQAILQQKLVYVPLEEALTELDEVIVRPYNLSGDLGLDAKSLQIGPVVTASTLGLPNAYAKVPTKAERNLYAATANPIMSFDPLINAITGRTKMLKTQVKQEEKYARTQRVRDFYPDSLYIKDLKIPELRIDDFMYFCEVDPDFQTLVATRDRLQLWEYMRRKSIVYRENNGLE